MRIVRAVVDAVRLAFARDTLGHEDHPAVAPGARDAPGVLHVLFVSREPLGTEPEAPRGERPSILRALFAVEELPFDPTLPPQQARRRDIASLFALEKLDDPP